MGTTASFFKLINEAQHITNNGQLKLHEDICMYNENVHYRVIHIYLF